MALGKEIGEYSVKFTSFTRITWTMVTNSWPTVLAPTRVSPSIDGARRFLFRFQMAALCQ